MKKSLIAILFSGLAYSQVGINTDTPNSTLDVMINPTVSKPEGIIAPRMTGDVLKGKDLLYGTAQNAALVYVTGAVSGTPAGKTIDVTSPGYYYYDATAIKWIKLGVAGGSTPPATAWYPGGNSETVLKTLGTNNNFDLPIVTNGTEKARLTTAGFFGVGTSTPTYGIHLESIGNGSKDNIGITSDTTPAFLTNQTVPTSGGTIGSLQFRGTGVTSSGLYGIVETSGTTSALGLNTDGTEKVRITGAGSVGIDTTNPQGIFNIDGAKDNPTTGSGHTAAQQMNDVTVLANGNLGLGTITPSQKLEIQTGGTAASPTTGFKLVDGNQAIDLVLTSDANGVGTWKAPIVPYKMGVVHSASNTIDVPFVGQGQTYWLSTGSYIDLPPGSWRIDLTEMLVGYTDNATYLTANDWIYTRFSLSELPGAATPGYNPPGPNSAILTPDFLSVDPVTGNQIMGVAQYVGMLFQGPRTASPTKFIPGQGYFLIKNGSTVTNRYYIMFNPNNSSSNIPDFYFRNVGGNWGENRIIATRIDLTN
ncbi:hypothetical protein [Chryseobacterium aurantiacum]|uniref:hypothetical protein n=1 Tax=Chryseobacterium aurantiacum TaxID=2116499 RepID=UPI000D11C432|nr:hypothetical protein [Chryseobacterium aurantiacum]